MPRPSPVRDAIADAVAGSARHDWSIEDLVATLGGRGVSEECGVVGEVPGCAVRGIVPQVQEATGFVVTGHQVLFSGVCPRCAGHAG